MEARMARKIDHDALFKLLLTNFFREFLELAAPELAEALDPEALIFLDKESFSTLLDPDRREADLVVQARLRQEPATLLIHLEHQAQADATLARRMFRYFARFYDAFDMPVYPIALCSYARPRTLASHRHELSVLSRSILRFEFPMLQLNRLDWRDFLQTTNPVAIALMARMHIAPRDRWRVKAASLPLLVGAPLSGAQRRLLSQFIDVYLRLQGAEEQAFQAEVATFATPEREAVMEIVTSWEQKGRAEGQRQVLELVLAQKLGALPEDLLAHLGSLSSRQLTALTLALPTLTSTDDLRRWLTAAQSEDQSSEPM
jgi:hypothetical protein